jgi:hypothetical protein
VRVQTVLTGDLTPLVDAMVAPISGPKTALKRRFSSSTQKAKSLRKFRCEQYF